MNITREDLCHQPKSGLIDLAIQKQKERESLQSDIDAFIAKGGKINEIPLGVTANYNAIRKEPYNNTLKKHNLHGLKTL